MPKKPKQATIEGLTKVPSKPVSFYLPPKLHARLKIAAAHEGVPMNKLVVKFIEKGVKEIGG